MILFVSSVIVGLPFIDAEGQLAPVLEDHGSEDSSNPSSSGRPRQGAYFPLYALLLCRVASARRLAGTDICRRRPTGQKDPRSGSPCSVLRCAQDKGLTASIGGWHAGAQLPHLARRSCHGDAQYLSSAPHRGGGAHLPGSHPSELHPKARLGTDRDRPDVDSSRKYVFKRSD